jgi:hypothetical protein
MDEFRVGVEIPAELRQYVPRVVVAARAGAGDARGCNFFKNAEFMADVIVVGRVASFQQGCTG